MILLPTKAIDIEPTATETALHVATWGAAGFAVHTWANGIRMRPLMSAPHLHVLFTLGGAAFGVFMHRFEQSRLQMLKAQRDILVKRRMERALEPAVRGADFPAMVQEVWASNLDKELAVLRDLVEQYPYVAMDTEFPGVVARPIGNFRTSSDYHYQTLRCNVDLLKIIQLGLTFTDAHGNSPPGRSTWQFNFKFNLSNDMYAQDSIDLLTKSGIDFKKHEEYGIDVEHFGELLISSGLVLFDDVKWISFHSGYDFGYLLKIVTCQELPPEETAFFELLRLYFPCIYDVKFLMRSCKNLKGGLQDVADELKIPRVGQQHQAGSDSLLTARTFFKMKQLYFEDSIDDDKYMGCLFGLTGLAGQP